VNKPGKNESPHSISAARGPLSQFEPGGSCGPIEDPNEYAALIRGVTDAGQREFLEEASRFATTWQYLSSVHMQIPPEIAAQVEELKDRSLSVHERVARMRDVNQRLMEFISKHDREDSPIRQ
jgi:hypothetical protein